MTSTRILLVETDRAISIGIKDAIKDAIKEVIHT